MRGPAGPPPAALGAVLAELGAGRLIPLAGGGTPAQVWRALTSAGDWVVIKFLDATAGLVDGHDIGTFRAKPRQIARVHAELPRLSQFYVRVIGEWHGDGWSAYAMPHYEGAHPGGLLRGEDHDLPGFLSALRSILQVLTEAGYAAGEWPAPSGHFLAMHVNRVRRRLPLLRAHLDPRLFHGRGVWVNGRRRPPLAALLGRLRSDHDLLADLQPTRLHYPVHGDLNLGNLVMRSGSEFTLLDPRGVSDPWDVIYDMGKILFSLTVFEPAMESGFAIRREPSAGRSPHYLLTLREPRPASFAAAGRLPGLLGSLPFFRHLDRAEPGWRRRLAFTHAMHCLAESACRLSDRKPAEPDTTRQWAACRERAYGLLLTGLALLDDLLEGRAAAGLPALEEIACPHRAGELPHLVSADQVRTT